jgi:hypothetical protein
MSSLNEQLFAAIEKGSVEEVAALLKRGASVNAKDKQGWTPLVHAFAEMHIDGAKLLMSKGAKASATDKYTYSPLNLMMNLGDKKTAKLLDTKFIE